MDSTLEEQIGAADVLLRNGFIERAALTMTRRRPAFAAPVVEWSNPS